MQYCSKCGHQMQDDAQFCPQCGTALNQVPSPAKKRLHCPKCGGYDLTPFVNNSGAILGQTTMNSSKSWICRECGNMFRHPDDVVEEAKKQTMVKSSPIMMIWGVIVWLGAIWLIQAIEKIILPK